MNKANKPLGLKKWIEKLTWQDLPVFPNTGRQLLREVGAANISLAKLAQRVLSDPILCFHVLKEANKLNHNKENEINNIEHCVTMLGLQRVQRLAKTLPVMKYRHKSSIDRNYVQAIIRSIFAAHIAKHWAELKHHHSSNEVYIAALLCGVTNWTLWRFGSTELRTLQHLVFIEKKSLETAEREALGCSVLEISHALAKRWSLPGSVREALNPQAQPNKQFIAQINRSPQINGYPQLPDGDRNSISLKSNASQIILANWLANQCDTNWYDPKNQRALNIASAVLSQPAERTYHQTQQIALKVSRQYAMKGIQLPAEGLLFPPQSIEARLRRCSPLGPLDAAQLKEANEIEPQLIDAAQLLQSKKAGKKPKATQTQADKTTRPKQKTQAMFAEIKAQRSTQRKSDIDEALFRQILQALKDKNADYKNYNEVLQLSSQAACFSLGLERSLVLQTNANQSTLKTLYLEGESSDSDMEEFSMRLLPNDFFTKILQKPTGLWLNSGNYKSIWPLIPGKFKQSIGAEEFMMMSIFSSPGTPVAVLCADQGIGNGHASERQYKAFKLLCQATSQCISNLPSSPSV